MPEQHAMPLGRTGRLHHALETAAPDPAARPAPEPAGGESRRGFVVSFVANSLIYSDELAAGAEREAAAAALRELAPALDELGIFEVFQPRSRAVRSLVRSVLPHLEFPPVED